MTQQPDRFDNLETVVVTHNEILNQLAPLTAQVTQLLTRTIEKVDQHSEVLAYHSDALDRIEEQTRQNSVAIASLTSRVDALTASTTDLVRSMAEQAVQANRDRAIWQAEINRDREIWQAEITRIWEYLLRQSPNGRGEG